MIIFKFSAGLGNQLYEYVMLRNLQMLYGIENIKADITDYKGIKYHNGFELIHIFGNEIEKKLNLASGREIWHYTKQIPHFSDRYAQIVISINRYLKKVIRVNRIIEEEILGTEENQAADIVEILKKLDCKKNYEISGYWTLPDYHDNIFEKIVAELQFPELDSDENIKTAEIIKSTNSVSVHIRRGDYVGTRYDVLTEEYYENAMEYVSHLLSDITWFFFSDDAEYVKEKYRHIKNKYIINNNVKQNSFRDMQLMSICKHNIIANSTFSEWGAIFNKNDEKVVVYPSRYETNQLNQNKKWEGWIKL